MSRLYAAAPIPGFPPSEAGVVEPLARMPGEARQERCGLLARHARGDELLTRGDRVPPRRRDRRDGADDERDLAARLHVRVLAGDVAGAAGDDLLVELRQLAADD